MTARLALAACLALAPLAACAAPRTAAAAPPDEVAAIEVALDELYRAFCFDAGAEPDWDGMRALFAEGATFFPPIGPGATPAGTDAEAFVRDFRDYATSPPVSETGLHERVTDLRIDVFGNVAHAYVVFDGFTPGDGEVVSRGLDTIQLVRDGDRWLLASFASQYEGGGVTIPARFRVGR